MIAAVACLLVPVTTAGAALPAGEPATSPSDDVAARGAFTCDFSLGPEAFAGSLPAVIERDRMYMAARPGMLLKHTGLRPGAEALAEPGVARVGGRYLFDSVEHARQYERFVKTGFVLDGIQFLSRSHFIDPDCHSWETVGAAHFASVANQVLVRTERYTTGDGPLPPLLRQRWPAIRAEAGRRGYTGVWLLHEPDAGMVSVVALADRLTPDTPLAPDLAGLIALESAPPLGAAFADQAWPRVLDRTQWTLTTWFPFRPGDQGPPSLWPHSAFPSPERPFHDGLCEPSRGENGTDNPDQCPPRCGDAVAQPEDGEDTRTCPSDVRLDHRYQGVRQAGEEG